MAYGDILLTQNRRWFINSPTVSEQKPVQTEQFRFNHSMLRVKDPQVSMDFYTGVLGMSLLRTQHHDEHEFSLYFLGFIDPTQLPSDPDERKLSVAKLSGVLELTHNHGTEDDPKFSYHSGNEEPKGFGHICVSVPDLDEAIAWFDQNEVAYQKRPEEGNMRDIAFIKDPDGYWIEIIAFRRRA